MTGAAFDAAAWSWVEHLRGGGTTTWREWRQTEHPAVTARWPMLPGAAQLEVVRRLAVDRADGVDLDLRALADLVATNPVGGRGLVDSPLPWGDQQATEPDAMPAGELLRVCLAAIAVRLPPGPVPVRARHPRLRNPWRRGLVVAGGSPHASPVRAALAAAGRTEHGKDPVVVILGAPLDAMMEQHWRHRVERGAGLRWRRLWAGAAARDSLPRSVDLAAVAAAWVDRVGPEQVHVVLEPEIDGALAAVGRIAGVAVQPPRTRRPADATGTDLLRRLNQVLGSRDPGTRGRLPGPDAGSPALGVPTAQLGWSVGRAEASAARLAELPVAVHGDPRVVVPSSDPGMRRSVDPRDTLRRALSVLAACVPPATATAEGRP